MSELYDILVETPSTKVILLALDQGLWDCERSLAELSALCEANHMEAVAQVTQKRQTPETGIVLGSGKLEEASLAAQTLGAECAVFDGELTGSQIRNISNALGGFVYHHNDVYHKFDGTPVECRCYLLTKKHYDNRKDLL